MTKLEELKIKADEAKKDYQTELNKPKVWSPSVTCIDNKSDFYAVSGKHEVCLMWGGFDAITQEYVNSGNYFTLDQKDIAEKEADRRYEASLMSAYVRENDPEFDIDEEIKNGRSLYCVDKCNSRYRLADSRGYGVNNTTVYMSSNVARELRSKLNSGEVSFKRVR